MKIFDSHITEIRDFLQHNKTKGLCREFKAEIPVSWPEAGPRDIVLLPDLALELGHPEDASLCFTVWTEDSAIVNDNAITLIGPDISEAPSGRLPFGKIILVRMKDCDEDTAYERYRNMDLTRFSLSLKGYMLRATSQFMREWSRISRDAVANGFSFRILGSALISALKAVDGIAAAEVIFITHSNEDVMALKETGTKAGRLVQAMNKMMTEMEADCGSCDYQDVCTDASEMKALHKTLAARKAEQPHRTTAPRSEAPASERGPGSSSLNAGSFQ
jgi:CO dehydrogenase/acetyl-CoA synthase beta subunit